jgi:hypothetical protein
VTYRRENRKSCRVLVVKQERKKQIGRNIHKCGDNVTVNLKEEEVGIE